MFPAFLPTMRSVACRIESFQNHITDELKREWHEKVDIIVKTQEQEKETT